MTGQWAAARDGSWFNHPNTSTPKVIHVATSDGFALCDPRVPLSEHSAWLRPQEVPVEVRCRRRACAAAFDGAH
ncbi:hypothetical protein [Agromyces sp. NPDC058104]|uniref:hypothetical protein n=1 Tax=Agromyces sp. NPDC058104 TaxID=3346342 RepID=UPI0036D92C3D